MALLPPIISHLAASTEPSFDLGLQEPSPPLLGRICHIVHGAFPHCPHQGRAKMGASHSEWRGVESGGTPVARYVRDFDKEAKKSTKNLAAWARMPFVEPSW